MFRSRKPRYVEMPALLPPKLSEFGHQPFTKSEQESLARWLREPTWPRGTLNIYALEGYLTALLVWPIGSQPGAWLPPIWNEGGWRVRPPIDTVQRYGEFLELVLGFLRTIDEGLLRTPPVFESRVGLPFDGDDLDMRERAQHWAQGFCLALRQGVQTRLAPTLAPTIDARKSVRAIAIYATDESPLSKDSTHRADINLKKAVLALANTRVSRGPLGALKSKT